jgi:hypothetical protein
VSGCEGRGRDVDGVKAVEVAVGPEPLECPRHVPQRRDVECSTGGRDPKQYARAVRTFGAASEERVEA